MFEHLLNTSWVQLVIVVIAGFLIGLEVKAYSINQKHRKEIGSVRTFTFIALVSYIFAKLNIYLYMLGYAALIGHMLLFYYFKLKSARTGILLFLFVTIVYSFGLIAVKFNIWFLLVVFVLLVFVSNLNRTLENFYTKFDEREIETFAKLILLSGVVLPLLPNKEIAPFIPVSYFKVWLAVVVVSMFSYVGYFLKKYIFKEAGYLLTGVLGGIYSSTATTIVLAKKASSGATPYIFASSIVVATALMYFRLLAIAFAFNTEIAKHLAIPYIVLGVITIAISYFFYRMSKKEKASNEEIESKDSNPLELSTAFLFAFLFVSMAVLTHFVLKNYGDMGLNILSFIVGFTDIDPFVLSILSAKFQVSVAGASTAILIATGSNNLLKALYAYMFARDKAGKISAVSLILLGIVTIGLGFVY